MAALKNQTLLTRISFACAGIASAFAQERSLRTQSLCALALTGVLLWLRPPVLWWLLCLLSAGMVLAAELLNTALERTLDHLHPDQHAAVKAAKDCAAAAVLITSLTAAVVGAVTVAVALGWL